MAAVLAEVVIVALILAYAGWVVCRLWKRHKEGRPGCGCSGGGAACGGCPGCAGQKPRGKVK